MSKTIPAQLLTHKAQHSTTLTELLLVGPLDDGSYRGMTLHDEALTYDPGTGPVTFRARTGFQMSALQATSDLGVDNAEGETLYPVAGFEIEGFTQTQIDAGALDKVPFTVYRVNYKDLTTGRHEIRHSGTIGEVRTKHGQMTILELRSLSNQLKQSIVELDSRECRAQFGSQPIGTGGGVIEERFPCGFDVSAEWVNGTVSAVGAETDRQFTDSTLAQAADYFAPGIIEWLTGDNAGQVREVEAFSSGNVDLLFPTVTAIQTGDTFRIRRECTKRWVGHNSCTTFHAANKPLHFRGEPHIPVGDAAKLNTPGAGTSTGGPIGTGEATGGAAT